MAYADVYKRAFEGADERATIDIDDIDSVQEFEAEFEAFMTDPDGQLYDHFPSAQEVGREEWDNYILFLDDYELWDVFRDEWEDYTQ